MSIKVIRLHAPLSSSKGEVFLKIQKLERHLTWHFLSTSPKRRGQIRKRGGRNILNPYKRDFRGIKGAVWLDEWQSFSSPRMQEILFEVLSDQGVEIVILSQSFTLGGEDKDFLPWLLNAQSLTTFKVACPSYTLSSSRALIVGLQAFAADAFCLKNPYEIPMSNAQELLIPFCIKEHSHLLSLARDYQVLAFKGPRFFYLMDLLLWVLGGHCDSSLIGSSSENKNRRHIDKEGSLSGQASDWRVSLKKWQASLRSLLRRPRWWKENEAIYSRIGPNVSRRIRSIKKH